MTSCVGDMLDGRTKCGACFTACPIAAPARGSADPKAVDILIVDTAQKVYLNVN
jgi:hypothetical protein